MMNAKPKIPKGFILWVGNKDMTDFPVKGKVEVIFRTNHAIGWYKYIYDSAEGLAWDHAGDSGDIIAYRKVTN